MHSILLQYQDSPLPLLRSRLERCCVCPVVPFTVVIALLVRFLLPSAAAVPVTHTFNDTIGHVFSGSSGAGGEGASIATVWNPPPSLVALDSILVQVTFTSNISVVNPNALGFPVNNTFIAWRPEVIVALPNGTSPFGAGSTQQVFASGAGTVTASGLFYDTLFMQFFGPAVAGGNPLSITMRTAVDAGTQFGSGTHTANFSAKLIYNVPDSGVTLLWLAPLVMLMILKNTGTACDRRPRISSRQVDRHRAPEPV